MQHTQGHELGTLNTAKHKHSHANTQKAHSKASAPTITCSLSVLVNGKVCTTAIRYMWFAAFASLMLLLLLPSTPLFNMGSTSISPALEFLSWLTLCLDPFSFPGMTSRRRGRGVRLWLTATHSLDAFERS